MQARDERRHELGNLLSIALANVEGMIDGLVEPAAPRLEALADALRQACRLVREGDPGNEH